MTTRSILPLVLFPALAAAQTTALEGLAARSDRPFHTTVSLSSSLGIASFVADDYADNPVFSQSLSLGPSYRLLPAVTVGLGWSLGWEYTTPDSPNGRRWSPSDISASISHSELYRDSWSGLRLTGSARAVAPTSYESRFNGTVTNLSLAPTLSRRWLGERLGLSYTLGFTKYLPTHTTRGFSQEECNKEGYGCAGGMNANFSFSNTLGTDYRFTDKLVGALALGITNSYRYAPSGGDWTKQRGDSTSGSLSVTYVIDDTYWVTGGISSGQPALDSRYSRPRFPFFDFETPANGFTSFGLTFSGTY